MDRTFGIWSGIADCVIRLGKARGDGEYLAHPMTGKATTAERKEAMVMPRDRARSHPAVLANKARVVGLSLESESLDCAFEAGVRCGMREEAKRVREQLRKLGVWKVKMNTTEEASAWWETCGLNIEVYDEDES